MVGDGVEASKCRSVEVWNLLPINLCFICKILCLALYWTVLEVLVTAVRTDSDEQHHHSTPSPFSHFFTESCTCDVFHPSKP